MKKIAEENELAATFVVTNDELELLLDRRSKERERIWSKTERFARLAIMKWSV